MTQSFYVRAKQRGTSALEALYDHFAAGDGSNLVYFPIFNYNAGSLDTVREMLGHPRAPSSASPTPARTSARSVMRASTPSC